MKQWFFWLWISCGLLGCQGEVVPMVEVSPTVAATPTVTAAEVVGETAVSPTTTPETMPTSEVFYYLLAERERLLLEVDPEARRQTRQFALPLPDTGNSGAEGLAFVSNDDIASYGFLGLPPSDNGGYFVVSVQAEGMFYVLDVGETAVLVTQFTLPEIEEDAAGLDYQAGVLWVSVARAAQLVAVDVTGSKPTVLESYGYKRLPDEAGDTEGILLLPSLGAAILADDDGRQLSRYNNDFPACMADKRCELAWLRDVEPLEPSGLAWDESRQWVVGVADGGELFYFDADGSEPTLLLRLDADLEGVAAVER
ncbi:MAG: hypothetical protein KDE56_11460 [Anaerolineales bacterium]|nr:hypothetical protein [Anaerolineales bacterium]